LGTIQAAEPSTGSDLLTALPTPPSRVEQVYDAIVEDICTGRITPGTPLRQEELAARFAVSRHPIQQALLLLKNQGLLREFGRRGLEVTPLDEEAVTHLYQLRAVLDGYAAREAAGRITEAGLRRGTELVDAGRRAHRERNYALMVSADLEFHRLLVEESGNPLLLESTAVIWRRVQRVMGEVLYRGGSPAWVWEEHTAILAAIAGSDSETAERLAREHAVHGEQLILGAMRDQAAQRPADDTRTTRSS
jgi:DNA-binding GntR family transcriptional regulator